MELNKIHSGFGRFGSLSISGAERENRSVLLGGGWKVLGYSGGPSLGPRGCWLNRAKSC